MKLQRESTPVPGKYSKCQVCSISSLIRSNKHTMSYKLYIYFELMS